MSLPFGSYVVSDQSALTAALAFDDACLPNYDFAGTSGPDQVDVSDIGRLVGSQMVGMNQSGRFPDQRGKGRTVVTGANRWPPRAQAGSELYVSAMTSLDYFQALHGIGIAKATKLLALKRPAFYPVIDDRVVQA